MRIDLRTWKEAAECPFPADIALAVPRPPLTPQQIAEASERLLAVAARAPKGTPIEVFCAKGKRSALATAVLRQAGYNAVDLGPAPCAPRGSLGAVTSAQRRAIMDFVRARRVRDDAEFHAFAKRIGVDPDEAEPVVYQMAHDLAKKTLGGVQDSKAPLLAAAGVLVGSAVLFGVVAAWSG
jgi:rhodanese-related sulfurtransferase